MNSHVIAYRYNLLCEACRAATARGDLTIDDIDVVARRYDWRQESATLSLQLVDDGRTIDRLVDVTGREVRVSESINGKLRAFYLDSEGFHTLDYFAPDEWDGILSEGTTRSLDAIAGTTYTIINW